MCEQGTLVVAFHTSSVHKTMYRGDEWHVASPLPKGCSHRVATFHTPFRHGISPTPHHYITRTEHQECSYFQITSVTKRRSITNTSIDDKASSKNSSCLTHAKCRKLQIQEFFHAYTRVRLTWLQSWQSPWHPMLQNTHSRTRKSGYESKLNPQTSKSFQYQACLPISSS